MFSTVDNLASIIAGGALQWTRNADKFRLEGFARGADDGIPMSAHVHEGKVWG